LALDGTETDATPVRNLLIRKTMPHGIYSAPFGQRQQVVMWQASSSFGLVKILAGNKSIYRPLFSQHLTKR
jgi:hypothetical protein